MSTQTPEMADSQNLKPNQTERIDPEQSRVPSFLKPLGYPGGYKTEFVWFIEIDFPATRSVKAIAEEIEGAYRFTPEGARPKSIKVNTSGLGSFLLIELKSMGLPAEDYRPWLEKTQNS